MIKIWSMKQNAEAQAKTTPKVSAAELRVRKDMNELDLPPGVVMEGGTEDPLNFTLTFVPKEGAYKGGTFDFTFHINPNYPHEPPKVRCLQKIYHPNIDLEGNICLNILREDWKPVLNLNSVIWGLQLLFDAPNADDPLNKVAADDLRKNTTSFERNVRTAMGGGRVNSEMFDNVLSPAKPKTK